MGWYSRATLILGRLWATGLLVGGLVSMARGDPDVERWFNRRPDTLWQPLVERWAPAKAAMTTPIENLILPVDHFTNGCVKVQLRAKKAQVFLDGIIFAEDVVLDLLAEDGGLDGQLTAEGCIFNRNTKYGYCKGRVTMVRARDRLKGRGMYFSFEDEFIKILTECEIRTCRIKNNFGRF